MKSFLTLSLLALLTAGAITSPAAAQKTWDGGGDGTNWGDGANWFPDGVPTSSDDVSISSGTVHVNVAAVTRALDLTGGTLRGSGSLSISGLFSWISGHGRRIQPVADHDTAEVTPPLQGPASYIGVGPYCCLCRPHPAQDPARHHPRATTDRVLRYPNSSSVRGPV